MHIDHIGLEQVRLLGIKTSRDDARDRQVQGEEVTGEEALYFLID